MLLIMYEYHIMKNLLWSKIDMTFDLIFKSEIHSKPVGESQNYMINIFVLLYHHVILFQNVIRTFFSNWSTDIYVMAWKLWQQIEMDSCNWIISINIKNLVDSIANIRSSVTAFHRKKCSKYLHIQSRSHPHVNVIYECFDVLLTSRCTVHEKSRNVNRLICNKDSRKSGN